jgi:hypothetical protein
LVALANQQRAARALPAIGSSLNPAIYSIAASDAATAFNDITAGSNSHPALTGYDLATGWGTPKASALVSRLGSYRAGPAGERVVALTASAPSAAGIDFGNAASEVTLPTLQSFTINDGSAQRSKVNSITLKFDRALNLPTGSIGLTLRGGGAVGVSAAASADGRTYTLTFSGPGVVGGSLADGVYDLDIAGVPAATQTFHRLFSDADGDGDSDNLDLLQLRGTYLKPGTDPAYRWYFDYDNNGVVDNLDVFQVRSRRSVVFQGY